MVAPQNRNGRVLEWAGSTAHRQLTRQNEDRDSSNTNADGPSTGWRRALPLVQVQPQEKPQHGAASYEKYRNSD